MGYLGSSLVERLWLFPLSRFTCAGEGQLSLRSDGVGACCPGPPRLSQRLMCCQRLCWPSWARGGRYFELVWLSSAWTLHLGPDGSMSCCESLVPLWVPSWVEIGVRAAFGDLELILCLLDTSEPHWLEDKGKSHNPES